MTSPSVDRRLGLSGGTAIKAPVQLATTANVTLSGEQSIDGVTTDESDVLVKNQTTASENGIYTTDTGAWTRRPDANGTYDFAQGTIIMVAQGTVNAGSAFRLTTATPVIGTSSLSFSQALFQDLTGITFTQAGSGAVARSAQDKMREWVTVEDFSSVTIAYSTRAAALAGNSAQTAIAAAIATGKNVRLGSGYYKWTGNLTMSTIGQRLEGCGTGDSASSASPAGTILVKASGTSQCLTLTGTDQYVGQIGFDGNSLAGSQIGLNAAKYCVLNQISYIGQGGTDYALKLYGNTVNLSSFYDQTFHDGNYGCILISTCLYSNFYNTIAGTTNGGDFINIGDASVTNVELNFHGTYGEGRINLHDICQSVNFFGVAFEECLGNNFLINGISVQDINVYGWRSSRQAAGTAAFAQVTSAYNVNFVGFQIKDALSSANHDIFAMDGAVQFSADHGMIRSVQNYDFLAMTGTRSDLVTSNGVYNFGGGGAGRNIIKSAGCKISNTNIQQTFTAGAEQITLELVSGTITRTNAAGLACINCTGDTTPQTTWASLDATPSVIMANPGFMTIFVTANAGATIITTFDDARIGMTIHVVIGDANTTVDFSGTNLKGNAGVDWTPGVNDSMICTFTGTNWYCVTSS